MNDTIENLNINVKFNDNLGDAAARLNELAESINKVNTAAGKTSAIGMMSKQLESLNAKTSKLKTASTFSKIGESTKRAGESTKGFVANVSTAIVKVAVFMRALRTLSKFVLGGITDLNKLSLGITHINTLFGEGADEVISYARSVEKLMGIPMADFLSTQGTLGNMLSGFGVATEKVKDMSQSLTQLSFDLEAFNSLGLNQQQLLGMMQSGLSGYDKSLRRLGFALREVELQEILHRNGLDVKVSELNRAGKSQLVYMAIMEQSAKMGAMGALGRQAQSPIVAFNMLKNQVRLLAQTLAGALLPVIMKSIKFLHALAMAATNVVVRIAALFGVQIKPIDFGGAMGGVSDYVDGLEDIAGNASGATKKIKELRDQMAGFDKLNVMKKEAPSTPTTGGGGVGGLGGMDLDIPMPDYGDFLTDMTGDVQKLAKVLEPILMILGAIAGYKVFGWITKLPWVATTLDVVGGFIGDIATGIWGVLKALGGVVVEIFKLAGGLVSGLVTAFTNSPIGSSLITLFQSIWSSIGIVFSTAWGYISKGILAAAGGLGKLLAPIMNGIQAFITPIIGYFQMWFSYIQTMLAPITAMFEPLIAALANVFGAVNPIVLLVIAIMAVVGAIIQLWNTNAEFKDSVLEAWNGIKETLVDIYNNIVKPIFDKIIEGGKAIWNESIKPLWDNWVEAFRKISMSVLDFWNQYIKPLVDWIVKTFGPIIVNIVGVVVDVFRLGFSIMSNVLGGFLSAAGIIIVGVIDVFSGIINFIKAVFTGDWKAAWEAVKKIFGSVVGTFFGVFENVWNSILGLFSKGGEIFGGIVEGVAGVFSDVVNLIIRGINSVIAIPFNIVNGLLNKLKDVSIAGFKPFNKFWGYNPLPVLQIPTLPSYDVGTGHVTHDHIAQIHKGEAIIPEKFNDKKYFGQQNDEETKKLLKEQNNLLMKILQKDSTVRVSSSDIESAGTDYRRMLVKAKGGV